jgi:hypothetical protein
MRLPSAAELVRVWELGQGKTSWQRGLLLLAPLFPDATFRALSAMALGTRNAHLLALREHLFGSMLKAIVRCPHCRERMEFSLSVGMFLTKPPHGCDSAYERTFALAAGGIDVRYRLLCSDDLGALAQSNAPAPEAALTARAIVSVPDGAELTPAVLDAVADAIVTADPLSDIRLSLDCASCHQEWIAPFDVASFLWTEIEGEVQQLIEDVHRLGTAYGWSEAAILTMSAQRRREYLLRAS